jgi:hypothetical protein
VVRRSRRGAASALQQHEGMAAHEFPPRPRCLEIIGPDPSSHNPPQARDLGPPKSAERQPPASSPLLLLGHRLEAEQLLLAPGLVVGLGIGRGSRAHIKLRRKPSCNSNSLGKQVAPTSSPHIGNDNMGHTTCIQAPRRCRIRRGRQIFPGRPFGIASVQGYHVGRPSFRVQGQRCRNRDGDSPA